jgi:hypothetical protein
VALEHDYSGLPPAPERRAAKRAKGGAILLVLVGPVLGVVLILLGASAAAYGADPVAPSSDVDVATLAQDDASSGAFWGQIGDALTLAGALLIAFGGLLILWVAVRPAPPTAFESGAAEIGTARGD